MKLNKGYVPRPIDTSGEQLSEELVALAEAIAKNVHEVWAKERLDDGWVYGPLRDDVRKEHPCLVEYESLPEREKDYDRATAMGTLKLIQKLGFDIVKR